MTEQPPPSTAPEGSDPAGGPPPPDHSPPPGEPPATTGSGGLDQGQMFALLSYASMFLGFPIFILPLAMRDDEFALYHARHAAAVYILWLVLFLVIFVLSFVTCGFGAFLVPIIFLVYIPTIHGMIIAARREMREPMMLFGLGEWLFGGIQSKPKP